MLFIPLYLISIFTFITPLVYWILTGKSYYNIPNLVFSKEDIKNWHEYTSTVRSKGI